MSTVRVWAPAARSAHVRIDGHDYPMAASAGGWWETDAPARPGSVYGFLLNGEGPFPDPRSPWQPHGVHGLSRVVDHAAFPWTDRGWQAPPLSSGVIYEIHTGTFTPAGTFDAAIERLPHLASLGVTHIEIMPVNQFSGTHGWGYDGVDLYAPHAPYGGPDALKRFVDACHRHGMAVIIDVVYNHLGPSGNYLARFGPYFTCRYCTPWGEAVNLDGAGSDEVRRFFIDNSLMWLRDYHADGLRLDAVHTLIDTSAVHFLEELAAEVRRLATELGRPLVTIAESDLNDPRLIHPVERGGYGLDAQWSDDFHHALHTLLTGERNGYYADFGGMAKLAKALRNAYVYDGCYSVFRGRRHGRPAGAVTGERFCVCSQNHDQAGNRAKGERATHLMSRGRLEIAAAMVLASPFVPLLFQGEEWAASSPFQYFTSHEEPELAAAVSDGRRREFECFGWDPDEVPDPQDPATFLRSKLDWNEAASPAGREMIAWYRRLIELRRASGAARNLDEVETAYAERQGWFRMSRGDLAVVFNIGAAERRVCTGRSCAPLLASSGVRVSGCNVELPPDTVAVVRV